MQWKSFVNALKGLAGAVRDEAHMRFHVIAALAVVAVAAFFGVTAVEWGILVLCIALVLAAEVFNSAIERLADVAQPRHDERIRLVKDMAAGAVLVLAVGAAVVGLVIFIPYLIGFLNVAG